MEILQGEVQEVVYDKVLSRSIDKKETKDNFEELGWY